MKKKIPVSRRPLESEKELRRLRAENRRLNDLSGALWVFRCSLGPAPFPKTSWTEVEEIHDKHRNAVARGR